MEIFCNFCTIMIINLSGKSKKKLTFIVEMSARMYFNPAAVVEGERETFCCRGINVNMLIRF